MPASPPNFSPFPFEWLPRLSREHAAIESAVARHVGARRSGGSRVAKIVGPVRLVGSQLAKPSFDPHAALVEVRIGLHSIAIAASGGFRRLANRVLGGADEIAAPRPPTLAEHAILAVLVTAALEDAGIAGEVWPLSEQGRAILERELADAARVARIAIEQRALIGHGGIVVEEAARLASVAGSINDPARPATVAGSRRRARSPATGTPATAETTPRGPGIGTPVRDPATAAGTTPRGPDVRDPGTSAPVRDPATAARPRDPKPVAATEPGVEKPSSDREASRARDSSLVGIELAVEAAGIACTIACWMPGEMITRVPPPREPHGWTFALPIVVARCLLPRGAVAALAVRDVIVVEPALTLVVGDGAFGLAGTPAALEARVTTGYVRAVASSDEASLPLTVQLGTTRLSLRRLGELAVGEVIGLGRPLAGPYEIHAGGRLIGHGELVDLDGETGIRIVSLSQE